MVKERINWKSEVGGPYSKVLSLLNFFRKLGHCLSTL